MEKIDFLAYFTWFTLFVNRVYNIYIEYSYFVVVVVAVVTVVIVIYLLLKLRKLKLFVQDGNVPISRYTREKKKQFFNRTTKTHDTTHTTQEWKRNDGKKNNVERGKRLETIESQI